jgi:hypothetical protein
MADANGNGGVNLHIEDLPDPAPNDSGHMYFAGIAAAGWVVIGAETGGTGGSYNELARTPGTFVPGSTYNLQVGVHGTTITVTVNGAQYASFTDTTYKLTFGSIDLRTYNSTMTFGPVTVTCD